MTTFYSKIYRFILTKDDSVDDITKDEADAILHFLLNLIEVQSHTMGNWFGSIERAKKLIKECGASISSINGYRQNNDVYTSYNLGMDNIEYRINIESGISVCIYEKYHMLNDKDWGCFKIPVTIPNDILHTTLDHDDNVRKDSTCLQKI